MPTYEYRCKNCEHVFERIKKISDPPVDECPKCGHEAERLISGGAGLVFKGSGFYSTDYRSDSYKKAQQKDVGKAETKKAVGDKKGEGKGSSGSGESGGSSSSKAEDS
jgi:putative FmdB family regulatory protein